MLPGDLRRVGGMTEPHGAVVAQEKQFVLDGHDPHRLSLHGYHRSRSVGRPHAPRADQIVAASQHTTPLSFGGSEAFEILSENDASLIPCATNRCDYGGAPVRRGGVVVEHEQFRLGGCRQAP